MIPGQQFFYELYIAHFTGQLSSIRSEFTKFSYSFKQPLPRVTRHQPYVLKLDQIHNTGQLLPLLMPDPRIR